MTHKDALLILNAIPELTNTRVRRLIEHFGSAENIFALKQREVMKENILPPAFVRKIFEFDRDNFLENEYNFMAQKGIRAITYWDESYPFPLKEIPDAPVLLYVNGRLTKNNYCAIAIVGSRKASFYGLSMAEKFAGRLAELGITIVSGMARGVDTAAHRGCLKAGGSTLAVFGCGLSHIYPPESNEVMENIVANGAVISEFSMETPPLSMNFPRRNRIVSGLSLGILVIEAASRSGALITSRFALEQGREVFALPGKVDHPNSQGTHWLIKQGAKLVSCVEDILEELHPQMKSYVLAAAPDIPEKTKRSRPGLTQGEQNIFKYIKDKPVHIDELALRCERPEDNFMHVLLQLECKHLINQLPGKFFVRK